MGLVSTSKTTQQIQQEAQDRQKAAEEAEKQQHLRLGLGLGLGLGLPLLLGIGAAVWFFARPRKSSHDQGIWDDDAVARPWRTNETEMREVDAASQQYPSTPGSKISGYGSPDSPSATPFMQVTPIPPIYFDREVAHARSVSTSATVSAGASASGSGSGTRTAEDTQLSAEASARYNKSREALQGRPQGEASSRGGRRAGTLPPPLIGVTLDPDTQPDIIIQHRDGGAGVVHELPPPYADRSLLQTSSSTPDTTSGPS